MRIDAVIFDHDGTLVDSEGIHYAFWRELVAREGKTFSYEEYLNHHCGVPSKQNAELICSHHQLNISPQQLLADKRQLLESWLKKQTFPLLAGAEAALGLAQKAGLKIGLATGAERREALRSLEGHSLAPYFQAVVTKDDVEFSKPAADTYLLAAQQMGVAPAHCIAVEDSTTGVASAKAAGMTCITVKYAMAKNQDLSQADYHCETLVEATEKALSLMT